MSNKFTDKAKNALNNATFVAESMGHTYIGSEHILLSIAKENDSTASMILKRSGVDSEKLEKIIKDYSGIGSKSRLSPKDMTPRSRKIVENSYKISLRYNALKIGTEHILLSLLEEKECVAVKILIFSGCDISLISDEIITLLRTAEKHYEIPKQRRESSESALIQYGKNLTEAARLKQLEPVIGRESETDRLIRILCRKTKNNPCLIGEAGVGKTAIVEGLADRIAKGAVPLQLKGKHIISVDLTSMVAGAKYRGDFEERIKSLLNEASKNKSVILFIDEIHTIVGAGSAEGAIDAANILKPQLSRAEIQLIGATTIKEYRKYIEKDGALERRFQSILIEEPSVFEAERMLIGLKERFERHHNIIIDVSAVTASVKLSKRYIQDRYLPDKAIDILDEACAKCSLNAVRNDTISQNLYNKAMQITEEKDYAIKNQDYSRALKLRELELAYREEIGDLEIEKEKSDIPTVSAKDVEEIINEITGIPISGLNSKLNFKTVKENLCSAVFGQEKAIDTLINAIIRSESGINNPDRPKGVFLFIGKSGVGKTELAKIMAKELFSDKNSIIKYDMSEFSEQNSVTKLIGSPPGYVGFEDGGYLTEKIRKSPYCVILFDEIEKAHPDVRNLLLQIMDEGVLTDSCGRKADFKNSYIIMTSNAGTNNGLLNSVGFMKQNIESISHLFSPEFINRIDSVINFEPLDFNALVSISDLKLRKLKERLDELGVNFDYSEKVSHYIAEKSLKEKAAGRAVSRIISEEIENRISSCILNYGSTVLYCDILDGDVSVKSNNEVDEVIKK